MKEIIILVQELPGNRARAAQYKIAAKRNGLKRFQHFIESTDWDEKYLCHKWIDKICLGIIALSILYFVPALASLFLK